MQKILRKRVVRELKSNFFRYFSLYLLIVMGMYVVVSIIGAADTIIYRVDQMANENQLEDGEFGVFVPLAKEQIEGLERQGITLEKMFYLDYSMNDHSTVRIYKNREKINLIRLEQGRMAEKSREVVIEKRYSEEHKLSIADTIQIGEDAFKIVGIGVTPDYDAPLKSLSDNSVDSEQFGLGFVTKEQYEVLKCQGEYAKTEEYIYSYRLNHTMTDDELKDELCEFDFDRNRVSDAYLLDLIKTEEAYKKELKRGVRTLVDGSKEVSKALNQLKECNPELMKTISGLPDSYGEFKQGVQEYLLGEEVATAGSGEVADGMKVLQEKIEVLLNEYPSFELENLTQFIAADENPRIKASSNDVIINKSVCLVAGIIIVILFTYVIAVFIIHKMEEDSSMIGTLYALGVKKKDLHISYLTLPVVITLLGGITGTILGFSKYGIYYQMESVIAYFSLCSMKYVYPFYLIMYGVMMPPIVASIVNSHMIHKKLSQPALKLIKMEHKEHKVHNIRLGNMGFVRRFQIRQLLRELRSSCTVVLGMFITLLVMMIGIDCYAICHNMSVDYKKDTKFHAMYTYKYPEKQVPSKGVGGYIKTLTKEAYGYQHDVFLLGIDKNNPYFNIPSIKGKNKVVIASSTAQKYKLNVGDKLVLTDSVNEVDYAFTVDAVTPYSVGLYVFMDIDSMRELFGKKESYYNVVFTSDDISIEPERLLTVTTKENISKSSDVFIRNMMPMILLLIGCSTIIFCVVMYLMMKVMIDRSALPISLIKIFGFRTGEIKRLYLNGNFYIIGVGALLGVPLSKKLIDMIFPRFISNVACGHNLNISWKLYGLIYLGILVCYIVVNQLLVGRLRNIAPAIILKQRE